MAAGSPGHTTKTKKKVEVGTSKLVLVIVEMYASEDSKMKNVAIYLVGCIIESYNDKAEMVEDILGTYVSKTELLDSMRVNMKRIYPEASKILSEVFGIFLFGEKL
jgi:hypothetical protein